MFGSNKWNFGSIGGGDEEGVTSLTLSFEMCDPALDLDELEQLLQLSESELEDEFEAEQLEQE